VGVTWGEGAAGTSWNWGTSRRGGATGSLVQQHEAERKVKTEAEAAAKMRMIIGFCDLSGPAFENSGRTVKQSAPKSVSFSVKCFRKTRGRHLDGAT
jgi:hypothetical protein